MPYHSSSDEEVNNAASSTTASKRGRRLPGRNLRRRRGDINADVDSSDENNNDGGDAVSPSSTRKSTEDRTELPDRGNQTMSPLSQEAEGQPESQSQSQLHSSPTQQQNRILEDPDPDTMRILISTDNHLGYAETDNVRGNDSFAALEEVLYLAKEYSCDMVLLAGDLFHENRPSRRTLYKTMDIFRRYCMGPGAIQVQVVSGSTKPSNTARRTANNSSNKNNPDSSNRSPFVRGYVNYEDANYSVDLPVFSIHGNHDDPSRDGGNSELYAALDLLDVANLVNYFGKQEDTTNIRVDPILLRKGTTQVALYGLGSMRDERLNRMWRGGHLTFSRPAETAAAGSNNAGNDNPSWFNIFALHQNRDRGRGTKNCIKEDMIPEWIDLVCWGHEHECDIELTESVVGTFRISQPGSSVATSLVEGESLRKKVAVLDVREGQFRLTSIPLTQVRSFVVSTVRLADVPRLDPDDPKVDAKVSKVLEEKVRVLIHDAREKRRELVKDAKTGGNGLARYCEKNDVGDSSSAGEMPLKHTLHKEDEVLVRLKVDHTGFAAVNNQRFGAKFVGDVANPTDILLFHRKKTESTGSRSRSKSMKDIAPIEPTEIDEMNIEELIVEQFDSNTTQLELFDDKKISLALDSYVGKQEARAINEALEKLLGKQQNRLIKNGAGSASEGMAKAQDGDEEEVGKNSKRKVKAKRDRDLEEQSYEDEDEAMEDSPVAKSRSTKTASQRSTASRKRATSSRKSPSYDGSDSDGDDHYDEEPSKTKRTSKSRAASSRTTGRGRKAAVRHEDSEDDDIRVVDPPLRTRRKVSPTRKRTAAKKIVDYSIDESDENGEDDDIIIKDDPSPPKKKRGRGKAPVASSKKTSAASKRGRESIESTNALSQSQLSFQPVKRKAAREPTTKFKRKAASSRYSEDSDSGDSFTLKRTYEDDDDDWGTAKSSK